MVSCLSLVLIGACAALTSAAVYNRHAAGFLGRRDGHYNGQTGVGTDYYPNTYQGNLFPQRRNDNYRDPYQQRGHGNTGYGSQTRRRYRRSVGVYVNRGQGAFPSYPTHQYNPRSFVDPKTQYPSHHYPQHQYYPSLPKTGPSHLSKGYGRLPRTQHGRRY